MSRKGGDGVLHVFATYRSLTEPAEVRVRLGGRRLVSGESAEILTGPDPKAANSFETPNVVAAEKFTCVEIDCGEAVCVIPALGFAAVTFRVGR